MDLNALLGAHGDVGESRESFGESLARFFGHLRKHYWLGRWGRIEFSYCVPKRFFVVTVVTL